MTGFQYHSNMLTNEFKNDRHPCQWSEVILARLSDVFQGSKKIFVSLFMPRDAWDQNSTPSISMQVKPAVLRIRGQDMKVGGGLGSQSITVSLDYQNVCSFIRQYRKDFGTQLNQTILLERNYPDSQKRCGFVTQIHPQNKTKFIGMVLVDTASQAQKMTFSLSLNDFNVIANIFIDMYQSFASNTMQLHTLSSIEQLTRLNQIQALQYDALLNKVSSIDQKFDRVINALDAVVHRLDQLAQKLDNIAVAPPKQTQAILDQPPPVQQQQSMMDQNPVPPSSIPEPTVPEPDFPFPPTDDDFPYNEPEPPIPTVENDYPDEIPFGAEPQFDDNGMMEQPMVDEQPQQQAVPSQQPSIDPFSVTPETYTPSMGADEILGPMPQVEQNVAPDTTVQQQSDNVSAPTTMSDQALDEAQKVFDSVMDFTGAFADVKIDQGGPSDDDTTPPPRNGGGGQRNGSSSTSNGSSGNVPPVNTSNGTIDNGNGGASAHYSSDASAISAYIQQVRERQLKRQQQQQRQQKVIEKPRNTFLTYFVGLDIMQMIKLVDYYSDNKFLSDKTTSDYFTPSLTAMCVSAAKNVKPPFSDFYWIESLSTFLFLDHMTQFNHLYENNNGKVYCYRIPRFSVIDPPPMPGSTWYYMALGVNVVRGIVSYLYTTYAGMTQTQPIASMTRRLLKTLLFMDYCYSPYFNVFSIYSTLPKNINLHAKFREDLNNLFLKAIGNGILDGFNRYHQQATFGGRIMMNLDNFEMHFNAMVKRYQQATLSKRDKYGGIVDHFNVDYVVPGDREKKKQLLSRWYPIENPEAYAAFGSKDKFVDLFKSRGYNDAFVKHIISKRFDIQSRDDAKQFVFELIHMSRNAEYRRAKEVARSSMIVLDGNSDDESTVQQEIKPGFAQEELRPIVNNMSSEQYRQQQPQQPPPQQQQQTIQQLSVPNTGDESKKDYRAWTDEERKSILKLVADGNVGSLSHYVPNPEEHEKVIQTLLKSMPEWDYMAFVRPKHSRQLYMALLLRFTRPLLPMEALKQLFQSLWNKEAMLSFFTHTSVPQEFYYIFYAITDAYLYRKLSPDLVRWMYRFNKLKDLKYLQVSIKSTIVSLCGPSLEMMEMAFDADQLVNSGSKLDKGLDLSIYGQVENQITVGVMNIYGREAEALLREIKEKYPPPENEQKVQSSQQQASSAVNPQQQPVQQNQHSSPMMVVGDVSSSNPWDDEVADIEADRPP